MEAKQNHIFQVEKQNIYKFNHAISELEALQEGEIRLKIDKYALTTNNITYAVSGYKLKYWDFYPTEEPYGIIPVWGYATVVASRHPEIQAGEQCFGYFPMATYCTLQPQKVSAFGFSEGTPHRQKLAQVYNQYTRIAGDPFHDRDTEDVMPIVRPLFATSFLIYHFLKNKDFLGAEQVIITSASAKTSLGLGFMLKQHQTSDGKRIIGLTSSGNMDFVRSTQFHDDVFSYEDFKEIELQKTVIIDISGNYSLLNNLSDYLHDNVIHIALVGLTDWKSTGRFSEISQAEFFFAPTHLKDFFKIHDAVSATQMLNSAMKDFIHETKTMIELEWVTDKKNLSDLYVDMVGGKVNPKKGYLVSL